MSKSVANLLIMAKRKSKTDSKGAKKIYALKERNQAIRELSREVNKNVSRKCLKN